MTERDPWMARLSEYVDGELAADVRVAVEAHLPDCADCRAVVADLHRVRARAAALADREPPRDLWPGIAARIAATPAPGVLPLRRRRTFTLPQLAAAAVLFAAVGAGSTAVWLRESAPAPVAGAPAMGPVTAVPAAFTADPSYEDAVADLERVLAERRASLDSSTVRVLEQSLATIDRAIVRARAALAADPNDPYLNAHLAETMRRKLHLMRRAATIAVTS